MRRLGVQVTRSVGHLNSIIEGRRAAAEQLAASVEEMTAHAEALRERLAPFHAATPSNAQPRSGGSEW